MKNSVFISYSNIDKQRAYEIADYLRESNFHPWIADQAISPGANFAEEIALAIQQAMAVIVLLSEPSLKSDHVKREVSLALERNVKLIPVVIDANLKVNEPLGNGWDYWLNSLELIDGVDSQTSRSTIVSKLKQMPPEKKASRENSKKNNIVVVLGFILSLVAGYGLMALATNINTPEIQQVSYIHEVYESSTELKDFPQSIKGYTLVNSLPRYSGEIKLSNNNWYVPVLWSDKDFRYPKCKRQFWVIRWENQNLNAHIKSAFASIWSYTTSNQSNGFAGYEDGFAQYSESKVGNFGFMMGKGCESPAFRMVKSQPNKLRYQIQVWQKVNR